MYWYNRPEEVLPYKCGPTEALGFTKRCAELCIKAMGSSKASTEGFPNGVTTNGVGINGGITNKGISNGRRHMELMPQEQPLRAMDVGCSVGGVTFELTKYFDEVKHEGLLASHHYSVCTN